SLGVFTVGKLPCLLRYLLDGQVLKIRRQQMVIPRAGDIGGEEEFGAVVGAKIGEGDGGDQRNPIQVDLVPLLQHSGQLGGTCGSVAFADQECGRRPTLVAVDVLVNEIGEPIGIGNDPVKLRRILPGRGTAVSGGNSVDEAQVRCIKEGILVI